MNSITSTEVSNSIGPDPAWPVVISLCKVISIRLSPESWWQTAEKFCPQFHGSLIAHFVMFILLHVSCSYCFSVIFCIEIPSVHCHHSLCDTVKPLCRLFLFDFTRECYFSLELLPSASCYFYLSRNNSKQHPFYWYQSFPSFSELAVIADPVPD